MSTPYQPNNGNDIVSALVLIEELQLSKPPHDTGIKPKTWSSVIQPEKCMSFDCVVLIQHMEYSSVDFLGVLSAWNSRAPSFKGTVKLGKSDNL
jgi:hypothetical protein